MLSNTAIPKYYAEFREKVLAGEIPVCEELSMEMNRIDSWIENPEIFYDEAKVEGWIAYCERELTLTDGSPVKMLPSFKLWGEQIFGWYYFQERRFPELEPNGKTHWVVRKIKKRLINKQYLIVARGAAKSMYASFIQSYFLVVDRESSHQIATAPTMRQADETLSPMRTSIVAARGPLFKFLTEGSLQNTTGNRADRQKLCSTKKGIEYFPTGSILEIRPMSIDKLQGLRPKVSTVDEWLSGDTREDPISALEQGATKMDDWLILATSSEGTVRNGIGDTIKMELHKILRGEYINPHVSIFYYKLDDISEVSDPDMWLKANPNLGKTVQYEAYAIDVQRAEHNPIARNDILAKRFDIPMEGQTYFFTYEETIPVDRKLMLRNRCCSLGVDLSRGDDFCAFTFLFPLGNRTFGIKARSYISSLSYSKLPPAMKVKYNDFMDEGSLVVLECGVLRMRDVYTDLYNYIEDHKYDVRSLGYDPYNADEFLECWTADYGPYAVEKVIQGARTESVPLGEIKLFAENESLLFDESIMQFCMGNSIVIEDTNGNRKLLKDRRDKKIDNVSALMDAWVAFKANEENFE